jgi:hypothetical protein
MGDDPAGLAALSRGLAHFTLSKYSTRMVLPPKSTDYALTDVLFGAAQGVAKARATKKRHVAVIEQDLVNGLMIGYAFGRSLIGTADADGLYSRTKDEEHQKTTAPRVGIRRV